MKPKIVASFRFPGFGMDIRYGDSFCPKDRNFHVLWNGCAVGARSKSLERAIDQLMYYAKACLRNRKIELIAQQTDINAALENLEDEMERSAIFATDL